MRTQHGFTLVELPVVSERKHVLRRCSGQGFTLVELPAVSKRKRFAFTLVELLVVITIIGILIAMLLPAVQSAREAARNSQCGNNLKQIGLAIQSYEAQWRSFPPGGFCVGDGANNHPVKGRTNWAICLLPFLEASNLYDMYELNLPNTGPENQPVLQTFLPVMTCPSDVDTDTLSTILTNWTSPASSGNSDPILAAPGSYKGVTGQRGLPYWFFDDATTVAGPLNTEFMRGPLHTVVEEVPRYPTVQTTHIRDGLTNTLLIGEYHSTTQPDRRAFWASTHLSHNLSSTQPDSYARGLPDFDACVVLSGIQQQCHRAFASLHSGNVMNFVTCAGNVIRITPNMDGDLFQAAGTIAGVNEPLFLLE